MLNSSSVESGKKFSMNNIMNKKNNSITSSVGNSSKKSLSDLSKLDLARLLGVFLRSSETNKLVNVMSSKDLGKMVRNFISKASIADIKKVFDILGLKKTGLNRKKMIDKINEMYNAEVASKKPTKAMLKLHEQFKDDHEITKYKKFDTLKIEVAIPPTTDKEIVTETIQDYLEKKFDTIKGRTVNVILKFLEVRAEYRTGEFKPNSFDDVSKKIIESIDSWEFDRKDYKDKELWSVNRFVVLISLNAGGCLKSEIKADGWKSQYLRQRLWTPYNDDNNCAIHCFNAFMNGTVTPTGQVKIGILKDEKEVVAGVRKEHYKNEEAIMFDKLQPLVDMYKVNAKVYEIGKKKVELMKEYDSGHLMTINLLLLDGHYHLIVSPNFVQYEKCSICNQFVANVKGHEQHCKRCKRCGLCYTKEHNICHEYSWKERAVKKCAEEKSFTAMNNIIYADFETITLNNKLHVYAVGYAFNDDAPTVIKGQDSLDKFVEILLGLNKARCKKTNYTLVFYNGSRFDLYFVYEKLVLAKVPVKKMIFSDGAYKTFEFNKITVFDLNMHIPGSLKSNCAAFGVAQDKSKGDFNHKKMITWNSVDEFEKEWKPYLELDIISMREMYKMYAKQTWDDWHVNINKFITLSSMAFKLWKVTLEQDLKLLPYEIDKFARRSIYGGRCYPQKQYFQSENPETDYLVDVDVVSLYPTAMAQYEYPIGEYKDFTSEEKLEYARNIINKGNSFGYHSYFAECDIEVNRKLVSPVIPRRDEKGYLQWDLHNITKGVYNSVDLKRAVDHGYKITKIYRILAFRKSAPIFKNYIEKVFKMKQKAKKDTPQYTISKLLMNALYGKMLQAPIIEKSKVIYSLHELNQLRSTNLIKEIRFLNQDSAIVYYETEEKDQCVSKPSYLGSLILGNSRLVMDKFIDAINGYKDIESSFFRTDTDSMIIHANQLPKVKEFIGKELGMLDYDIQGRIIAFAEVAPKVYICEYIKQQGDNFYTIGKHIRAKGFSKDDQNKLSFKDFENMLFGSDINEQSELKDSYGNAKGTITRKGDQIEIKVDDKLKKVGFNVNSKQKEKGYSFSNIVSESMTRTINKTKWNKRVRIPGHKHLASLPLNFCYE